MSLMTSRRFAPLFWTQFLSAFSDNFLKNALVLLVLFRTAGEGSPVLVTLAGALFILPFLLLSALGGEIADANDKAAVARKLKFAEIGASVLAAAGLALSSVPLLFAALFAFGTVSALFGPVKYGILPDHLPTQDLPSANAWIEGATFAAILGGTILAGLAFSWGIPLALIGLFLIALSLCAWLASRTIPAAPAAVPGGKPDRNILRSTARLVASIRQDRRVWRAGLMSSWFWAVGAVVLSLLPILVGERLGGGEAAVTVCLAVFAVAVAAGSGTAAWLGKGRIVLLPAAFGTVLMAVFAADLAFCAFRAVPAAVMPLDAFLGSSTTFRVLVDLGGLAFSGALVAVPSFAAVQAWAPVDRRARTIAAVNVVSAGAMVCAGLAIAILQALGLGVASLFAILAGGNVIVAVLMVRFLPTNPLRDAVTILFRAFHRLEIDGLENIAKAGRAPILAINHTSFLDAPLALALTQEEPVFAIDRTTAMAWWIKPFLKFTRALPLDPTKPMATRTLVHAVDAGDPLVIFPEGRITVTGRLMKIYDGAAMVADKTGSMIVPICVDGLQRSPFSRLTNRHVRKTLFPKVKVTIMEPVQLDVPADLKGRARRAAAGAALNDVMSDALAATARIDRTIPQAVLEAARDRGNRALALQDPLAGKMTYGRLILSTSVLARLLDRALPKGANIGILLPNANATCVAVLASMWSGRVPAMLNFTAGTANVLSAITAAEIPAVVTSRTFIAQAKLESLIQAIESVATVLYMEDFKANIRFADKIAGYLRRRPVVSLHPENAAAILFTSGSEGTPKGVVLTHRNIMANVAQAAQRIDFDGSDKVFNVLPMFHSFGLTAGTLLPLVYGVPTYLYPSPLHYRIVPEAIYGSNATILFGTDTFLSGYARKASPYDFRSLRYVFAGAEPVKDTTRKLWSERFGIRLLEGYGVTETAPVLALNTPMFSRLGTVGRLLPGIEARLEPVAGIEDGGRLHVRGPNVMAGYLRAERPGIIEKPDGGWHDTGDIVSIDDQGFVTIRGRAKRFAKIGGEMISLAVVEGMAADIWPDSASVAVALPDERKGERIVLLSEEKTADRARLKDAARSRDLSELFVPAEVRTVEHVPLLGTGKIDFGAAEALARNVEQGEQFAA